ncbi:hypothetical protein ACMXYV_17635 [Neptuniibacter sp. SY11_33]|uniref:hypothetical protein n=1 Tax=unclassified Neptuniibacter TaxID=2630693 RepID=UPI0039F66EC3
MYLAILEQFLFWGGLLVFLVSLAMYAGRTKDFKSLVEFWKPTMDMTKREFNVNRVGLMMMIGAVAIKLIVFLTY